MELGGMAGTKCTWPFEGSVDDGYAPGCYGYSSGSCDNIAFFGVGGGRGEDVEVEDLCKLDFLLTETSVGELASLEEKSSSPLLLPS